jgi:hypothetical protein
VEGIDTIGDGFIKDECKLCVASLFMHLLWVFLVYVSCLFLLLFCMNLCICRVFVSIKFCIQFKKQSCGIAQHVVGDVTE